jgi:poly(beta-D-mannuronate) lyase
MSTVTNSGDLKNAMNSAGTGDVIIVAPGTYKGDFKITANGSRDKKIVIRGERLDSVIFEDSLVDIRGLFVSFENMTMKNSEVEVSGSFNRVTNNIFRGGRSGTVAVDIQQGSHNRVDHNEVTSWGYFAFRLTPIHGTVGNRFDHNYLHDYKNAASKNEPEAIQIGNGRQHTFMHTGTIIEDNLIERVEINGELISIKSSGTVMRNNTFRNDGLKGTINVRHGNSCIFADNVLYGVFGGLSMRGDYHTMVGNVLNHQNISIPSGDGTQSDVPFAQAGAGITPCARYQLVAGNQINNGQISVGNIVAGGASAARDIKLFSNKGKVDLSGNHVNTKINPPKGVERKEVGPIIA